MTINSLDSLLRNMKSEYAGNLTMIMATIQGGEDGIRLLLLDVFKDEKIDFDALQADCQTLLGEES